jgi:hypothetical protein
MTAIEAQTHSSTTISRAHPLFEGPTFAEPRSPAAAPSAEVRASRSAMTETSPPASTRVHHDTYGSHLVNCPFEFAAFMILTTGLVLVWCGLAATSERLAVVGFLLTLVGASFHGCSLFDE